MTIVFTLAFLAVVVVLAVGEELLQRRKRKRTSEILREAELRFNEVRGFVELNPTEGVYYDYACFALHRTLVEADITQTDVTVICLWQGSVTVAG